jgi:hypothetical protein
MSTLITSTLEHHLKAQLDSVMKMNSISCLAFDWGDRLQLESVRGLMYWQIQQVKWDTVFIVLLNVPIQVRPCS